MPKTGDLAQVNTDIQGNVNVNISVATAAAVSLSAM